MPLKSLFITHKRILSIDAYINELSARVFVLIPSARYLSETEETGHCSHQNELTPYMTLYFMSLSSSIKVSVILIAFYHITLAVARTPIVLSTSGVIPF